MQRSVGDRMVVTAGVGVHRTGRREAAAPVLRRGHASSGRLLRATYATRKTSKRREEHGGPNEHGDRDRKGSPATNSSGEELGSGEMHSMMATDRSGERTSKWAGWREGAPRLI